MMPGPATHEIYFEDAQLLTLHVNEDELAAEVGILATRAQWLDLDSGEWDAHREHPTGELDLSWDPEDLIKAHLDILLLQRWHAEGTTGLIIETFVDGRTQLMDPATGEHILLDPNALPHQHRMSWPMRLSLIIVGLCMGSTILLLLVAPWLGKDAMHVGTTMAPLMALMAFALLAPIGLAAYEVRRSEEWEALSGGLGGFAGVARAIRMLGR